MRRSWAGLLLLLSAPAWADDAPLSTNKSDTPKAVRRIAAAIDKHLADDWAARKITPAPLADDEEFCRRAYLDVLGRIPKVAEVRAFADDTTPDKRAKLVTFLLSKPGYATNTAARLRAAWLPETVSDQFKVYLGDQYEAYLRRKLTANEPLDKIVRQTLTAEVAVGARGRVGFGTQTAARPRLAGRPVLLPGARRQAGEPGGDRHAGLPRFQAGVRPVPRPPVRPVHPRPVLAVRRLLRRVHPAAAHRPQLRRPARTAARQEPAGHSGAEQAGDGPVHGRHRPEVERDESPAGRSWPTGF